MSAQIDATYRAQRLQLASLLGNASVRVWDQTYRDRDRFLSLILPLVKGGQAHTVRLMEAYMLAKAADAREQIARLDLPAELYTVGVLRGLPEDEVYARPFGALGAQLEQGADFAVAMASGRAALQRLTSTDLQMAHTRSARDFMVGQERIVGYRRVLGGGDSCPLCRSAATRTYSREDLAPIHERCHCSVAPVFGDSPVPSVGTSVKVVDDPELGPRLVADDWSATGPVLEVA